MRMKLKRFQGRTTTYLILMDSEIRDGTNHAICAALEEFITKVNSDHGVELECLSSGNSFVIDLAGMLFWVNCNPSMNGEVNVIVSNRRARI